ncbi:MAG: hypothetical protein MUP30_08240, partial [Deltaproteobacteria bacterium]|nr:hypothetical protein [Deltaproteobacteria bacterium]
PQVSINYFENVVGVAAGIMLAINANRHGFIIQAPSTNGANFIYLGFNNLVTNIHYFVQLAAGASWSCDDYRGEVWAIASAAAQITHCGEW